MAAALKPEAPTSPLFNLFEAWFTNVDNASRVYQPFLKGFAQGQLELMGFMNRRVQAYAQLPGRLAQCRTPQDVYGEQMRFWRQAVDQYVDSSRKIASSYDLVTRGQLTAITSEIEKAVPQGERQHDYINFVDPSDTSISYRTRRDRKVA